MDELRDRFVEAFTVETASSTGVVAAE